MWDWLVPFGKMALLLAIDLSNTQYNYHITHINTIILPVYLLHFSSRKDPWKISRYQQDVPLANRIAVLHRATAKIQLRFFRISLELSHTTLLHPCSRRNFQNRGSIRAQFRHADLDEFICVNGMGRASWNRP